MHSTQIAGKEQHSKPKRERNLKCNGRVNRLENKTTKFKIISFFDKIFKIMKSDQGPFKRQNHTSGSFW